MCNETEKKIGLEMMKTTSTSLNVEETIASPGDVLVNKYYIKKIYRQRSLKLTNPYIIKMMYSYI